MTDAKFKQGDRVLIIRGGTWGICRSASIATVAKVYKTGNFVLDDGDKRQWRQDGYPTNNDSSWARNPRLHPYTDALLAEIEAEQERDRILRAVWRIGNTLSSLREKAAGIWADLPESIRRLAE